MTDALPPLPETDWVLHMPARQYEREWTSSQEGYDADQMRTYAAQAVAEAVESERQRCAAYCDLEGLYATASDIRRGEHTK